jgi:hypothetical protein
MNQVAEEYYKGAFELLSEIGLHYHFKLIPLQGGRNNKVFRLDADGKSFLLKSYFFSSQDSRDRLYHEFSFTNFAWTCGICTVPKPFASLPERRIALYEFIDGLPANQRVTTIEDIRQASDFILSLNRHRANNLALELPAASEACFSIEEHVINTTKRINRLSQIEVADDFDQSAKERIKRILKPLWYEVSKFIDMAKKKNPLIGRTLSVEERWISPSDFGFHNAIEEGDGQLRFIDFEYAGWDDPAKLLCDFANQPDRILENSLSLNFTRDIIATDVNPEFLQYRYALLEPLYQIKWACIILNDFLPMGGVRRKFTRSANINENKRAQLEKLDAMLHRVNDTIKSNVQYLN